MYIQALCTMCTKGTAHLHNAFSTGGEHMDMPVNTFPQENVPFLLSHKKYMHISYLGGNIEQ